MSCFLGFAGGMGSAAPAGRRSIKDVGQEALWLVGVLVGVRCAGWGADGTRLQRQPVRV